MSTEARSKYLICSRLLNGEQASTISKDFDDVSYPTILRYKRELEEAQNNNQVAEFLELDKNTLADLMELAEANAPQSLKSEIKDALTNVSSSKNLLDTLSAEMVQTATTINKRLRGLSASCEHASELESITESLCKLQNAFFNKNSTQVNVQNNYDSTGNHRYSSWLSDAPESDQ